MEIREYFGQRTVRLAQLGEGRGYISSANLLSLIKDEEVKQYVINKYALREPVDIELPKIDLLTAVVAKYVNRFDTQRLIVTEDNVTTSFLDNEEKDVVFTLKSGTLDGLEVDELNAIALYDSIRMFYDNRKLSQYITILKDAAAASIWGAQSGNGVIVITTKRAKFNEGTKLNFNNNVTIIDNPDLYAYPQISSSDYIEIMKVAYDKGRFKSKLNNQWNSNVSPLIWLFKNATDNKITETELEAELGRLRGIDQRDYFLK